MSVKALCAEICSDRSYRRYVSGERQLPQKKIFEFCNRLDISPTDFYSSFLAKDKLEFQKVYKLYDYLVRGNYDDFKKSYQEISKDTLLNKMNQKFYASCMVKYQLETKQISDYTAFDRYSAIVDFPSCSSNEIFDYADIIILDHIAELESSFEHNEKVAMYLLKKILLDDSIVYITSEVKSMMPGLYATISSLHGRTGDVEACLEIADKGIELSLRLGLNFALTRLYYLKSWSLYKRGLEEEAFLTAAKCLANAISYDKVNVYKSYYKLLKDDFKVEPRSFFDIYFNKTK